MLIIQLLSSYNCGSHLLSKLILGVLPNEHIIVHPKGSTVLWKHTLVDADCLDKCDQIAKASKAQILYVVLSKHPASWIRSMIGANYDMKFDDFRCPVRLHYHKTLDHDYYRSKLEALSISKIRGTPVFKSTQAEFSNLFDAWNQIQGRYETFLPRTSNNESRHVVHMRFEDVLNHPKDCVNQIANKIVEITNNEVQKRQLQAIDWKSDSTGDRVAQVMQKPAWQPAVFRLADYFKVNVDKQRIVNLFPWLREPRFGNGAKKHYNSDPWHDYSRSDKEMALKWLDSNLMQTLKYPLPSTAITHKC